MRTTLIRPAAILLTLCLVAPAASAKAVLPTDSDRLFQYELKALGGHVGEATLTISAPSMVDGKKLRAVRVEGKTDGLAATLFKTNTTSTSFVDAKMFPVAARWAANIPKGTRTVKARFDGRLVDGQDFRNGKLKKSLKVKLRKRSLDLVSIFPYLMTRKWTEGNKFTRPIYDGIRIYNVTVVAGAPEEITIPIGLRKAIPLKVTVWRRGWKKEVTMWLDERDGTPYKLAFKYGILGSVEAMLTGERTRTLAKGL